MIVAGVAEVGWVAIAIEGDSSGSSSPVLGIILLLVSQLFTGTMFIVEEKLLSQYYLDPFKVVGTEGMWGVLYYLTLLPFMQLIHCSGDQGLEKLCNFGYLENSSYAFKQMSENGVIVALAFMMAASIAIFNVCGIMTTKYASAAQRSTIDTSRTLIIWIMSCLLKLETFEW